jgi:predicted RecB family nuclease
MAGKITRDTLESYLLCKTKAHLKLAGHCGDSSDYERLLIATRQEVREKAIAKILERHLDTVRDIALSAKALRSGPAVVLDAVLDDNALALAFDGLKKVDGPSKLGEFHYVPILFHEGHTVGKDQRLLLEVYGVLLSQIQGRLPSNAVVWHGRECRSTKIKLNADMRRAERLIREVKELASADSPPRLILNNHCQICEFRQRCHDEAILEDNISLLRGVGEKEISRFARRGIFTVSQLAHTFRPRRKGKRQVERTHKRFHALQALAVRDKRVYVLGTPDCPPASVKIYVDAEGDPDEGYVYLIGMIVVQGDSEQRYSFWADSREQESHIFEQFLAQAAKYSDFRMFCYGGYERAFIKRMRERGNQKQSRTGCSRSK